MQPVNAADNAPLHTPFRGLYTRFHSLLRHGVFQNAIALYIVQFSNYALQLLTVPFLARVLGPSGFGVLAIAQVVAQYIGLWVGYGFDFSGTREVARHRDDRDKLGEIFAGVVGVKLILALISVVGIIFAQHFVPLLKDRPLLLWSALAWGVTVGITPNWYFQGMEQMRIIAVLDIAGKAISSIGILCLIRSPGDAWKMLAIQAFVCAISISITMTKAYRQLPFRYPSWHSMVTVIRMGFTMFLYRSFATLNSVGNAFVLGLFAPTRIVGFYSGGERLIKAFQLALWPVNQAVYPRLSRLYHESSADASKVARLTFLGIISVAVILGAGAYLIAPFCVRTLLGPGFGPAIPVMRFLSLLIILNALNSFFGMQCMLPLGLDRAFNGVIVVSGLANIGLAVWLAPRYGEMGMAYAVVAAEALAVLGCFTFLCRANANPLRLLQGNWQPRQASFAVAISQKTPS